MKIKVITPNNKVATFDLDGWILFKKRKWNISTDYVRAHRRLFHREFLGLRPNDGLIVDHINGDKLDNRRSNLRFCTKAQNAQNMRKRPAKKYKGVSIYRSRWTDRVWYRARIRVEAKEIALGYFDSEEAAAEAYNNASKKYFGEFSRTE